MKKKILLLILILMLTFNSIGFSQPINTESMNAVFDAAQGLSSDKRDDFKGLIQGAFTDDDTLDTFKSTFEIYLNEDQKQQITDLGISFGDIRNNIEILKTWSYDDRMDLIDYGFNGNQAGVLALNEKNTDPADDSTNENNDSDTSGNTGGGGFIPPTVPDTEPVDEAEPEPAKKEKRTNKKETVIMYIDEFIAPKAGTSLKETLINKGLIHNLLPDAHKNLTFNDTKTHWANKNIKFFADRGIINGIGKNDFGPNNNIKESEILALLTRVIINNNEKVNVDNITLKEIDDNKWYKDIYKRAYILGLIDLEEEINPEGYPSRERIISLFIKSMDALNFSFTTEEQTYKNTFTDFKTVNAKYKEAIIKAINLGIINGNEDNTLTPNRKISRAEVATMLKRYYGRILIKLTNEEVIS